MTGRKRSSSSSAVSASSSGEGLPEKVKALQVQAYKKVDDFTSQFPKLEGESSPSNQNLNMAHKA
jgi:hypothetical protein